LADFREYEDYDGLGLAELVRRKQVSAGEILEAALARIERLNPQLGCVVLRIDDAARRQAAAPQPGAFTGVPLLVKDLYLLVREAPLANGSRLFRWTDCPIDATLTERYRRAGFVICGRTSSPEFGLNMASDPVVFGPTRNPWNRERSAGGSSGGAAAAVAARMVPLAHGTDGGGSIRIPASNCGLVGLKPTRARNPAGPIAGEAWSGLAAAHTITRTVRDCAAALDATAGPAEGDPYPAPPPPRSFLAEAMTPPARLRIALQTRPNSGVAVHPDCVAAAQDAAKLCAELGHTVEEAAPDYDYDAMFESLWVLAAASVANAVETQLEKLGRKLREDDLEPVSHAAYRRGTSLPVWRYARALNTAHAIGRRHAAFFRDFDVALSPVMANPPLPLGAPAPNMREPDWQRYAASLYEQLAFTPLYNVSGAPAMSVPLGWNGEGLPVGVQIGAAFGNEAVLFRLAAELEAARPWFDRKPAMV
jgi:amidase/6-aminohexanoate-cyclic-dimer hydrolase